MLAFDVQIVSKIYSIYSQPLDRLKEAVLRRSFSRKFYSLNDVSFSLPAGSSLGIIGENGAGKSTLLKILAGTLTPTAGRIKKNGVVAALLELGAGFHPEFTGRQNIYLNASLFGLSDKEIRKKEDDIIAFAELGEFIDQPLKTYSSGMAMRLAFSVATSVDPDILIIDEALSVGDGVFAQKSFERIMQFKKAGKTILFCSHSLYQVEVLCDQAIWLHRGEIVEQGEPAKVVPAYMAHISPVDSGKELPETVSEMDSEDESGEIDDPTRQVFRIKRIEVSSDGKAGRVLNVKSNVSEVCVSITIESDPALPSPSVAVCIRRCDGVVVSCSGTHNDGETLLRTVKGGATITLCYPFFPLLKGTYEVIVYLMCDQGILVHDHALAVAELHVEQEGLEQGVVRIDHNWIQ